MSSNVACPTPAGPFSVIITAVGLSGRSNCPPAPRRLTGLTALTGLRFYRAIKRHDLGDNYLDTHRDRVPVDGIDEGLQARDRRARVEGIAITR